MLLKIQNVTFGFSAEQPIFNKLTFNLEQGRIYALMGANGSGKTTLFNLISGFHRPHEGNIVFKQQNVGHTAPYKINRKGIGRTFQDLRLASRLTVKENILLAMQGNPTDHWINAMLPASLFKNQLTQLASNAETLLADYFLLDVQHSLAQEISFGQQKLLNLACCVANGADLLLLDEPVAGISPQYREQIARLIQRLPQQGKTVLMIEHNTDFIQQTGERFLYLDSGALMQFDTFAELQHSRQAVDGYF